MTHSPLLTSTREGYAYTVCSSTQQRTQLPRTTRSHHALPASLGGYLSAFLNAHESLFRIIAQIEVTQVFIQAVMLCIGGTSLTDVLLLANFIWLRYAVSSFVRETIGLYTNPYLDSPNTPGIVRSIPQKFKALAPSPQQPS